MMKQEFKPLSLRLASILAIIGGFIACGNASAGTIYNFTNITNNSALSSGTGGQYSLEILGSGDANLANYGGPIAADQVLFLFKNNVGAQSSISEVYFQDGTLFGMSFIRQSSGVDFSQGGSPPNLPGGTTLDPDFLVTQGYLADRNRAASNGVNSASEWLGIVFNLASGATVADVNDAMTVGFNNPDSVWNPDGTNKNNGIHGLRIGIHVGSFSNGESESFVNTIPAVVPAPPALVLGCIGGAGLLGFQCIRRRKGR